MATPNGELFASLTSGIQARMRDVVGNVAILGCVALLALTVWVACIAGLVAVLAPLLGVAGAIFSVALVLALTVLILLVILRRRVALQEQRAAMRKAEARRNGQMAVVKALLGLVRKKPNGLLVGLGLIIGATIIAALQEKDKE